MSTPAEASPRLIKLKVSSHKLREVAAATASAAKKPKLLLSARDEAAAASTRSSPPPSSPIGSLADATNPSVTAGSGALKAGARKKSGPKRKPKAAGLTEAQLLQQQQGQQGAPASAKGDVKSGTTPKLGPKITLVQDAGAGSSGVPSAARSGSPAVNATLANGTVLPEGYRLLDRSGRKCRRWRPSKIKIQTISGTSWQAPSWAPVKDKEKEKDLVPAV